MTVSSIATHPGVDRFLELFERVVVERSGKEPEGLSAQRRRSIDQFAELGFPTSRDEEWQFTNIAPIVKSEFVQSESTEVTREEIARFLYDDCVQIVLVNGRFSPELSRLDGLPDGAVVSGLADAIRDHGDLVEQHLGRYASTDEHAFVALNNALYEDGALIWVPRNVVVETPINLVLVGRPSRQPVAFFPRLLFVAEESSQVTVFEQHVTVGEGPYFTCPVLEVVAGDNATIDHYKLQRESLSGYHMSTLQVQQGRDSNFSSHCLSWGGAIVRNDVNAKLVGEGGQSILNGLYMVEGQQLVDNHMRVEHVAPNCYSHELYKGILEGSARAVFTGRIFVHEGAQKTDAVQSNRNLLLSQEALCHSQPQLEIFADDVKCTHGSTVGQLDDLAVFYLRSRGIGEVAARSLLTYAFASDIVNRVAIGPVRRDLEEFLFRRLPKGEIVRQAV